MRAELSLAEGLRECRRSLDGPSQPARQAPEGPADPDCPVPGPGMGPGDSDGDGTAEVADTGRPVVPDSRSPDGAGPNSDDGHLRRVSPVWWPCAKTRNLAHLCSLLLGFMRPLVRVFL